jgi:hypothetical protein
MKSLMTISALCLFLTGYQSCRFLDWNCSEPNPKWSNSVDECQLTQRQKAKQILKEKYSDDIQNNINYQCIKNTNYQYK